MCTLRQGLRGGLPRERFSPPLQSNHRNRPSGWLLLVADSTGRCDMAVPFFVCVNFVETSVPPTPEPCGPVYAAIAEDAQVELIQANA